MIKIENVKPIDDKLLIEPDIALGVTTKGIIVPEIAKEKPIRGTVVAAGPGLPTKPVVVKPGDSVLYGKHAGTEVVIDEKIYLIMRQADVFAIV